MQHNIWVLFHVWFILEIIEVGTNMRLGNGTFWFCWKSREPRRKEQNGMFHFVLFVQQMLQKYSGIHYYFLKQSNIEHKSCCWLGVEIKIYAVVDILLMGMSVVIPMCPLSLSYSNDFYVKYSSPLVMELIV